ncbi:unnamed protein product [Amoebophrya sp. A120]|nr:unnamed protein product [Amoebophrya sp. A120]|eukprot:GSA120T00006549001.1
MSVQPSPERHRPLTDVELRYDVENPAPPVVPECRFRNVNDDLELGPDDDIKERGASAASLSMSSKSASSSSRMIHSALAAAQRALTPPKYNLDYHASENFPNYRQGQTPPRSAHGTPVNAGTPRQDHDPLFRGSFEDQHGAMNGGPGVLPPPPRSNLFAHLPVDRRSARGKEDSEPSSDTPIHTPSVTPHGTPRSDMTNKVFSAARHGKHKVVEDCLLAEEGYFDPLTTVDHHGNTLFHIACQNGNRKIGKLAIKYGGNMDAQNLKGNTGLHFLYQFGYGEIAEYFISKGANPNVQNQKGFPCYQGFKGNIGTEIREEGGVG